MGTIIRRYGYWLLALLLIASAGATFILARRYMNGYDGLAKEVDAGDGVSSGVAPQEVLEQPAVMVWLVFGITMFVVAWGLVLAARKRTRAARTECVAAETVAAIS